jgi:hypothetical protein
MPKGEERDSECGYIKVKCLPSGLVDGGLPGESDSKGKGNALI